MCATISWSEWSQLVRRISATYLTCVCFLSICIAGCGLSDDGDAAVFGGPQLETPFEKKISSELRGLPPITLDELAQLEQDVVVENPIASEEELAEKLVEKLWDKAGAKSLEDLAKVDYYGVTLTNAERDLIVANLWTLPILVAARDAANREEKQRFGRNSEDTKGDAFRHAYWNVRMSRLMGTHWAERFGTAHESETPTGLQRSMDLNNNAVGRGIFLANKYSSDAALAKKIEAQARSAVKVSKINASYTYLVYLKD